MMVHFESITLLKRKTYILTTIFINSSRYTYRYFMLWHEPLLIQRRKKKKIQEKSTIVKKKKGGNAPNV
jgi:hypothetical protein